MAGGQRTWETLISAFGSEIEAMMATTKHQVREWRVELQGAKEEVKVARMEVAHVKSELQMEKQTTKAQALEIKVCCFSRVCVCVCARARACITHYQAILWEIYVLHCTTQFH
jgi:hypothetical protein